MRAMHERTAPRATAHLERAVRDWTRRRLWSSGIALVGTAVACAVLWSTALRTSAWRSDVQRTGAHAMGRVVALDVVNGHRTHSARVEIDVEDPATGASFTLFHTAPALTYVIGDSVDVWYDPANVHHARTAQFATDNDRVTVLTGLGALATGLGAAACLLLFGYGVVAHCLLREPLRSSAVSAVTRRRLKRADHRALLQFRDTGTAVWTLHHHSRVAHTGDAFVVGRGHWRLVAWPTDDRPYLCRRPWTTAGRRAWTRALHYGGERS